MVDDISYRSNQIAVALILFLFCASFRISSHIESNEVSIMFFRKTGAYRKKMQVFAVEKPCFSSQFYFFIDNLRIISGFSDDSSDFLVYKAQLLLIFLLFII